MVSNKAICRYEKYYTRKDRRAQYVGLKYKTYFHYTNYRALKHYRKQANGKLRRYRGDVGNHGWYKKFEEVWYMVF